MKKLTSTLFGLWLSCAGAWAQNYLASPLLVPVDNDATSGTTLYTLAKLTSTGQARIITTADTSGIVGIVQQNAGTTGRAAIAAIGQANCLFDAATTAGDYVTASVTAAGKCHDAGASFPSSGTIVGRVLSTNASAGTYRVFVFPAEVKGATISGGSSAWGSITGSLSAQSDLVAALATKQSTIPANTYDVYGAATTAQNNSLQKSANFSDLASVATARTNLGLGSAAQQSSAAFDPAGAAAAITLSGLGGVTSAQAAAAAPVQSVASRTGAITLTASDIGGLAASATTDTTNAANLTSGLLPVARGGTGTATPGIVAGSNVTVTGTWPNQTIDAAGGGGSAPTADSINALFGAHIATPQEVTGVNLVTNGDFSNGLTGWTVSGDGTGWSIVGGKLHHTPGSANKISAPAVVRQANAYLMHVEVASESAGFAYFDLGVDCNSDCSPGFTVGTNIYLSAAYSDDGNTVVEIQPDATSDITITSVALISTLPVISLPSLNTSSFALGSFALRSNTTGFNNSAIGLGSLSLNTTGFNNSAVGTNALYSNTTGNYNSAVGPLTLYSNTTGSSNSAVGTNSLYANTEGSNNSAIGFGSLSFNTTGSYNSALGTNALRSNQTGYNNSAVGPFALYSNSTGYSDVAIGYGAAYEPQTSHDLTAIISGATGPGLMRGSQIETNDSVLIGPVSTTGTNSNDAAPLENVVAINGVATASNQTVLGNPATTNTFLFGIVNQPLHTPASSSEACTVGDHADDANFHYVCVSANTWRRVALSSF